MEIGKKKKKSHEYVSYTTVVGNKWPSRPRGGRATKSQVFFQDDVGG